MRKKLSEMSLEELWQLFPIYLTEHQDCWSLNKDLIINNGYICMSQSEDGISFNKGYTEDGFAERVFV